MKIVIRGVVVGAALAAVAGCGPKADPGFKAANNVALVSVIADCDISSDLKGPGSTATLLKDPEMSRSPRVIDAGASKFAAAMSGAGWKLVPREAMVANEDYVKNTFEADLKARMQADPKAQPYCTGGGYRELGRDDVQRAAAIAKSLKVDAVVLAQFQLSVGVSSGLALKGHAKTTANGLITVIDPSGKVLYSDRITAFAKDEIPVALGSIDWALVPANGSTALEAAGEKFVERMKKMRS